MRKHTSCIVPGCTDTRGCGVGGKYFSRGYCAIHYALWKRNGKPDYKPKRELQPCVIDGCIGESKTRKGLCHLHYQRLRRFGDPLAETTRPKQSKGYDAENIVGMLLRAGGRNVKRIFGREGDLLVDGSLKIEVKTADIQTAPNCEMYWAFNIHRHGTLDEKANYYIFRFLNLPGAKTPLHAAFRGPLGVLTIRFSLAKMCYELAPALQLFEDLKSGKLSDLVDTSTPSAVAFEVGQSGGDGKRIAQPKHVG